MKKAALLTLPLLIASCNPSSAPGSGSVTVSSSKASVSTTNNQLTGNTTYTFTNKAGAREVTINSATLTWTDPTSNTTKTETVNIPAFTLPAGLSCAAATSNPTASCNFNDPATTFADRTISRAISDAELFGKLLSSNPSVTNLPVNVQFNSTQNALPFTFSSAARTDGGDGGKPSEAAPKPLITINTTGSQPYSGNLSVTVSGNFDATSKVKSLILEVRDSRGNIDNTTFTSVNPTTSFSIDTSKYPDGPLTLKAIALTDTGLRGESATQTVQIQNVSAPTIAILSPDANSTLTGPSVVRVQFRQSTTAFTLTPLSGANDVRIDVRDFRGQVVKTAFGKASRVSEGIYEAFIPIDLIGPEFSSNAYTITASAQATLADGSTRTLGTTTPINTRVNDTKPPALNVLMPAYFTDPFSNPTRPVLSRNSALMMQASDDVEVSSLRLDFTCDQATALPGQSCPSAPYTYNIPVNVRGIIYRVFQIGALLDAQPFVQNGNYTLRVTAFDGDGNTNIQEMPVRVSRAAVDSEIANLASRSVIDNIVYDTRPGELNIVSARWVVPGTTANPVRVATLAYDNTSGSLIPSRQRVDPILSAGTSIQLTQGFAAEGIYRIDFIVEDLVTGVTRYYEGPEIVVKRNAS
ncbi:hypothetical protein [Deinococcus multiflagellatus]|uniref:Ig-like domain-containing protein n=1 Tax=Deinococcus multiflagellatus TaxID=1656887 RepID=A0ABW1ZH13_9DEIO|nr:hypothetical protein [Deinococcus multiflagellatus]MBZ9712147.1 hypothetical protein [Deinococcus multiflagellatus]